MAYSISDGTPVFPSQTSYQLIELTDDIVLSWPNSFTVGSIAVAGYNEIIPNAADHIITLPNAMLASQGTDLIFNNLSQFTFDIFINSEVPEHLYTVEAGEIIDFKLYDTSTEGGGWRIIPFVQGTNDIVSFTAASTNDALVISNGTISPPGGTINFTLSSSLASLNSVGTTGIPVIKTTAPLTWTTREIVGGNNITVTNGDGIAANPNISLSSTLTNIESIQIGDTVFTEENLYTSSPNTWCVFTDTVVGLSNTIVIQNKANVATVTGSDGSYTINFTTPQPSINYAVFITIGTTGGTSPVITHGYWTSRATTSVTITIADASGVPVSSVPNGVSVMVMSS